MDRAARLLNEHKKALNGTRVLVLGAAYKGDIDDYRESPAISVMQELLKRGALVDYYDPWVPKFRKGALTMESLPALTEEVLGEYDLVVVATAHTNVDYALVQRGAKLIFDTKNAMKDVAARGNIEVL